MIVRPADLEKDALAIMDGARDFVARMDYTAFLPETDEDFVASVGFLVTLPGFEILLAEHEGSVVGGIGLLFAPHIWNRKALTMAEQFIWCASDAPKTTFLRLMNAAEARRVEKGARLVEFVNLTSSPEGVGRVYRAMGLRKVQEGWMGAF